MSEPTLPVLYKTPRPVLAGRDADTSLVSSNDFSFAAQTNSVPVIGTEFTLACKHFPILFTEGEAAQPVVLLGLRDGENLFVGADGQWEQDFYVPAYIRRYPFIFLEDKDRGEFVLCLDEASPAIVKDDSNPLFKDGKPTELAQRALDFCQQFQAQHAATVEFAKALAEHDLLVDNRADITLVNGGKLSLNGFKVIDEAKFNALPAEEFLRWRERGWLHLVYCHFISFSNWAGLIDRVAKRA
ncbi:SapC family protein [Niveispirillum fermenti]|uniref:SapC family protein n=1 Tax=Niveispirillum fermenti TaxID=1233113 RepID=UPI003A860415